MLLDAAGLGLETGGLWRGDLRFGGNGWPMKTTIKIAVYTGMLGLASVLVACGSSPAPVSTRSPPASERIQHHIVSRGETLYAIAWRYELAPQQLATANGLAPPYTLRIGQRLTLDLSRGPVRSHTSSRSVARVGKHTVLKGETLYGIARRYNLSVEQLAIANGIVRPYTLYAGQSLRLERSAGSPTKAAGRESSTASRAHAAQTHKSNTSAKLPAAGWKWRWPAKGKITRFYDSHRVFKGINIHSRAGRAVRAAAPGVVVYAGDGLRGYGRLIIVKHSETYLSAYAHNRKILVKEGAQVTSTSKIAEVGGDSANPGRLYFEIRKDGKPVDPVRLLPTQ